MALVAWANNLTLGLGLEAKRTGGGVFWDWAGLRVIITAIAEEEWVAAGFEAVLVVIVLRTEGALETSRILFLELVGGGKDALTFLLPFLLVTNIKATFFTSNASTTISTSGNSVGIWLEP